MKRILTLVAFALSFNTWAQMEVPPCPLPGTSYQNAPLLDCCLDGYHFGSLPGGGLETPADFCYSVESGQWLAFRADIGVVEITFGLEVENCGNADGMEMQVYGINGDCSLSSLFQVSDCLEVSDFDSVSATGLVPGHVYYILLDGNLGDICEYTLTVLSETDTCDAPDPYLDGPGQVNAGQTITYAIVIPPSNCFYENQNPCNNTKQDTVSCAAFCNPQPLSFTWTGPPGAMVVPAADGYSAQVTFGGQSGEVCVQLTDGCFTFDGCIPVDVCQPFNIPVSGIHTVTGCAPAQLFAGGNYSGYFWSNGQTGPAMTAWTPGSYFVQAYDQNGCEGFGSVLVDQVPAPTVMITGANSVCEGNTVTLTAVSTGMPGFYNWNTGANQSVLTGAGSGNYSVSFTDSYGCTATDSHTVIQNPAPSPVIQSSSGNTLPPGGTSVLNAGSGFTAYQWSTGATTQTITVNLPGNYSVTVTGANGCTGSNAFDLAPATSIASEDCHSALALCSPAPFHVPNLQGPGVFDPVQFSSCLADGEHQTFWFTFTFETAGTFEFIATPNGLGADLDFALYMGGCPDAGGISVACNYAGPISPPGPFVPTGISSSMFNAEIVPPVNVQPGVPYYLIIDNITNNGVGFDIDFAGTAAMGAGMPAPSCAEAPIVPCQCLEGGFNGQTGAPNVTDVPPAFCGSIENEQWIAFTACWCTVTIEIEANNSTNGGGVEAQLFSSCAPGFQPKTNCITVPPGTSGFLSGISCVVGQTYYLLIDGVNGDTCDYTVTITEVPTPPVQILQDTIFGPTRVCAGDTVTYLAPPVANAAHCTFTFDGDSSQVIDPTHNSASIVFGSESGWLCFIASNCTSIDSVCMFIQMDTASFTTVDTLRLCQDDLPFAYGNLSINSAGVFVFDTLQSFIGCDSFLQVLVEISPLPQVEISVSGPINSANLTAVLQNIYFTTPNNETYLWAGPGINAGNQNDYAPEVALPGNYSLIVTDTLSGCSATATAEVLQSLCNSYNLLSPPGDSCQSAPLFCGENLDGFCSNNGGYTADTSLATAFGCSLENTQWIRFTPCETDVELTITTADCLNGDGLEAGVFSSNDCENFTALQSCITLASDSANTFTLSGLTPGEIYYLVLDGISGDACDYRIDVVSGISTDPPQWVTVNEGYIDGPSPICVGDLATYFIVPPDCELLSGGAGGCPLPPEACPPGNDSTALIWHIPSVASFLGDSVNVDTVEIIWNGLPTPGDDSIWVEFQYFPDTTNLDSLVFCDCTGSGCNAPINGMTVQGQFFTENLTAHLDCNNPSVDFCGQTITTAGIYACPIPCGEQILTVTEDFDSQTFDLGVVELCPGECFELMGNQYCAPGSYTEHFVNPANGCDDTYTFTIIFLNEQPLMAGPVTELCDATGQFFTVGFSIVSGTPPYFVDGVQIPGSFYQSSQLPSGQAYSFEVADAATCNPGVVMISGTWECPCLTNPGSAATNLLSHCESEMAAVAFNNDAQLGPDDLLLFVLHTGSGATLGNILGVNTTGVFSFDAGSMNYGQTYYISPVAGPDDGSGMIDFAALCAMAAPGQPVVFYENPTADVLSPATLTCDVTDVTLDVFTMGGSGSFSYAWTGPGGFTSASPNPNVSISGDYDLILTDDLSGCSTTAAVFIDENIEAPAITANGGTLSCAEPEIQLEASSTTPGVAFAWTLPSGQVVSGENILANETGDYSVVAIAPNGCTAEVQAEVTGTTAASLTAEIEASPPTCFGNSDGFIKILGTGGGEAPYLLLVNGSPLPPKGLENLPPGEYLLAIEDANGCAADTLINLPEPAEVTVSLGEDRFIQLSQSVTLDMQASIVPSSVEWSGPDGQSWQDVTSLLVQPMESGIYSIVISDIRGCSASDEVNVFVEGQGKVFIPSAFSPNGDGQNDVLMIYAGPDVLQIRSFMIFDRWGMKVFEDQNFSPNDPAHGWNGMMKGKAMKPAVFVYRAEVELINGEKKVLMGDVTLVR